MVLRADSGFYSSKVTQACAEAGVSYSVTVRTSKALHKVIAAIEEEDWTPIPYWIDDGAEVAETTYRPFSPKHPEVRLIVRRVRPRGQPAGVVLNLRLPRVHPAPRGATCPGGG
jgi:hypothetical protein